MKTSPHYIYYKDTKKLMIYATTYRDHPRGFDCSIVVANSIDTPKLYGFKIYLKKNITNDD